jgi:hypothetical protein
MHVQQNVHAWQNYICSMQHDNKKVMLTLWICLYGPCSGTFFLDEYEDLRLLLDSAGSFFSQKNPILRVLSKVSNGISLNSHM